MKHLITAFAFLINVSMFGQISNNLFKGILLDKYDGIPHAFYTTDIFQYNLTVNPAFLGITNGSRVNYSTYKKHQYLSYDSKFANKNNQFGFSYSRYNYPDTPLPNVNTPPRSRKNNISVFFAHQFELKKIKINIALQPSYISYLDQTQFIDWDAWGYPFAIWDSGSEYSVFNLNSGLLIHNEKYHIGLALKNILNYHTRWQTGHDYFKQHYSVQDDWNPASITKGMTYLFHGGLLILNNNKFILRSSLTHQRRNYINNNYNVFDGLVPISTDDEETYFHNKTSLAFSVKSKNFYFVIDNGFQNYERDGIEGRLGWELGLALGYENNYLRSSIITNHQIIGTVRSNLFDESYMIQVSFLPVPLIQKFKENRNNLLTHKTKKERNKRTKNKQQISFNKFDREFPIERIFVVANAGEDCSGNTHDGQDLALLAETILLGEYDILERKHFEQVLDEQRLASSGLLLEETAVELGCNAGSQGIIFTEVGCLSGHTTINLKLVGCQSSEIYWSCIGIGATPLETVQKVQQELSK